MRFLFSLLFSLFLLQGATAQVITRLSGGTSYFYYLPPLGTDNLAGVVAVAAFNDTIILPGGVVPGNNLFINKPLTLIGAGFFPSGTPVTGTSVIPSDFNQQISIGSAGAGSSFHGISFEDNIAFSTAVMNVSFTRCEFAGISLDPFNGIDANGVQFKQCNFKFGLLLGSSQNISLNNCIIQTSGISMTTSASNIDISQCILLYPNTNALVGGTANSTWKNNIFVLQNTSTVNFSTAGTVQSNLFALTGTPVVNNTGPALYTLNQVIPLGPLGASNPNFVNISSISAYNLNVDDYNLRPNGQAFAMNGLDGYKVGIHSGPPGNPWKPNAIPFNPHWTGLLPSGGSLGTTGGVINVTIQGAAQQN